jgi:lipopolysaccharide export system permease protein
MVLLFFRYIGREVIATMLAVTFILDFIFMANQMIRWLGEAASGNLAVHVIVNLLALELPFLLGLLLPLGLSMGILVVYSRLYAENEMTVMFAAGMSRWQLMKYTLMIAFLVVPVIAALVLWLNPMLESKKDAIIAASSQSNLFATLIPEHFQTTPDGQRVFYLGSLTQDRAAANEIFMAERVPNKSDSKGNQQRSTYSLLIAEKAHQYVDEKTKDTFVIADQGYRYEGVPGSKNYQVTQFKHYAARVKRSGSGDQSLNEKALPTMQLWRGALSHPAYAAQLQWRLSMPICALVLALLSMVLSQVNPRQSRFQKFTPAVLLYILYVNLLFISQDWLKKGVVSFYLGMWWVHLFFLLIAFVIYLAKSNRLGFLIRLWAR